jgi:cell division protein ZapA (FtsZ GTPase activity inhibitor)
MDKLQIKVRGRNYTLRTDESPARIAQIAHSLDEKIGEYTSAMKGMSEHEILTITAFSLMEELERNKDEFASMQEHIKRVAEESAANNASAANEMEQIFALKESENDDMRERLREFEKMWDSHTSQIFKSAADELAQLAKLKEQEMSELRNKLQEYENTWGEWVKKNRSDTAAEFYEIAANRERESTELFAKLVEYEKVWDTHAMEVYNSAIAEARETADGKDLKNKKLEETLENFEKMFDDYAKRKESEILRMQEEIESLKLKLADASDGQMILS